MLVFKKEKEARKQVLGHLNQVQECLTESRNALEAFIGGDSETVQAKRELVSELESGADSMVRHIREVLLDGAFLPHIRSDVYRLVGAVDTLANKAEGLSRFLADRPPALPDEFKPDLLVLYQHSLDSFGELREALRDYFKPKGVLENLHVHVTRVGELESEVDRMESRLLKRVFASQLSLGEKLHLENLIKKAAEVSDLTEDAADELEFAAMKSVV
jgi:predicted phosphate transport protein (TIGR00153 family)